MLRGHSVIGIHFRWLLVLFILLMISPTARDQANDRRDGNWWRAQSVNTRYAFMTGFLDGLYLGNDFSYWGLTNSKGECVEPIAKSFSDNITKFVSGVTNAQLSDGLDSFYEDYRNRRIRVDHGVWLVLNEISGKPKDDMDRMIENWRRNAD